MYIQGKEMFFNKLELKIKVKYPFVQRNIQYHNSHYCNDWFNRRNNKGSQKHYEGKNWCCASFY